VSDVVLGDDAALGPEVQVDYPGYRSTQWRAPKRPLATIPEELHSLTGPVFGEDVLVETWQANAAGRYNHPADTQNKALDPGFRGWARTGTDFVTGLYTIRTIKPGA